MTFWLMSVNFECIPVSLKYRIKTLYGNASKCSRNPENNWSILSQLKKITDVPPYAESVSINILCFQSIGLCQCKPDGK